MQLPATLVENKIVSESKQGTPSALRLIWGGLNINGGGAIEIWRWRGNPQCQNGCPNPLVFLPFLNYPTPTNPTPFRQVFSIRQNKPPIQSSQQPQNKPIHTKTPHHDRPQEPLPLTSSNYQCGVPPQGEGVVRSSITRGGSPSRALHLGSWSATGTWGKVTTTTTLLQWQRPIPTYTYVKPAARN